MGNIENLQVVINEDTINENDVVAVGIKHLDGVKNLVIMDN